MVQVKVLPLSRPDNWALNVNLTVGENKHHFIVRFESIFKEGYAAYDVCSHSKDQATIEEAFDAYIAKAWQINSWRGGHCETMREITLPALEEGREVILQQIYAALSTNRLRMTRVEVKV